jgi:ubiquinone/menaquinone biosynthesis C-methylase UbiE
MSPDLMAAFAGGERFVWPSSRAAGHCWGVPIEEARMSDDSNGAATGGVLLVGSVPLRSTEEVFQVMATELGDRLSQLPDGETGPRSDWIVWQYPVLSSRPEFEICPPGVNPYRALPRLRIRDGESISTLRFDDLGYAEAALSSYRTFARRKRDGQIPVHVRFQVSLPTPLAPIAAFVAPEDQASIEPLYEERMMHELTSIFDAIPHDQLAIQWDTNFEFAMLDGVMPTWFTDPRSSIVERLVRLGRSIPAGVQLGYHFCHGHERDRDRPYDARPLVEIANALSLSLSRSLDWIHLPVQEGRVDLRFFETLGQLSLRPETRLYLGLIHPSDGLPGARARIVAAQRFVHDFGVATDCGWGRHRPQDVGPLVELHKTTSTQLTPTETASARFEWPEGWERIPDQSWTHEAVDAFGSAYDHVDRHSWYRNLDPTVEELSHLLVDGDIVIDYSGGTGILVDRLKLRMFDTQAGIVIVDSSPKFLRVALEKFRADPNVGMRLLRFLKEEKRLERLDEVLGRELIERGVDAIVSTNAIHLYPDLADTVASWMRVLRPGGHVLMNSGNIRNPRARRSEWILDETVWVVGEIAEGLVRTDPAYAAYAADLDDADRMKAHAAYRDRVFLHPRPLDFYLETLELGGLKIESVREASIEARVDDWFEFLSAYHEAVLGWVGGTEKVDGTPPSEQAVADRLTLMRHAMDVLFHGRPTFQACWTYITCVNGR